MQSVTITTNNGARALIDAGGLSRVFDFTGNSQQAYRLENVSLENGNGGSDGYGGAISAGRGGTLTIVNSSIITSTALMGGGVGGAIYAAAGTLNLVNDDLENDEANAGSALNIAGEITTITNTNISNNSATGNGSAIDQFSISNHAAVLAIQNSTFFNNQSSGGAASIVDESLGSLTSTVTYAGSIFSTSATGSSSASPNFSNLSASVPPATFASLGNNIASDGTGNLIATGDQPNTLAGLFLSGPEQIASGQAGYVIGQLSLVWPNVVGTANFQIGSAEGIFQVLGNILSLQPGVSFGPQDPAVTVSIKETDDTGNGVGPDNTNFRPPGRAIESRTHLDHRHKPERNQREHIDRATARCPDRQCRRRRSRRRQRFHVPRRRPSIPGRRRLDRRLQSLPETGSLPQISRCGDHSYPDHGDGRRRTIFHQSLYRGRQSSRPGATAIVLSNQYVTPNVAAPAWASSTPTIRTWPPLRRTHQANTPILSTTLDFKW